MIAVGLHFIDGATSGSDGEAAAAADVSNTIEKNKMEFLKRMQSKSTKGAKAYASHLNVT